MSQLKADEQIAVGVRPETLAMRRNQLVTQRRDPLLRGVREQQLVGVRTAVVANGHRFSAPDELRAARPEVPPSSARQFGWIAVARAVPALHRQNRKPISQANAIAFDRLRK